MEKPQQNGFIVYFRLVQNQTTVGMMVTQENVKVKTHQCQREQEMWGRKTRRGLNGAFSQLFSRVVN